MGCTKITCWVGPFGAASSLGIETALPLEPRSLSNVLALSNSLKLYFKRFVMFSNNNGFYFTSRTTLSLESVHYSKLVFFDSAILALFITQLPLGYHNHYLQSSLHLSLLIL